MKPYQLKEFSLHVTNHCNYNCRHCMHFAPYMSPREYQASDYFAAIDDLAPHLENVKITLTGGETFLHSDLPKFVRDLKERYPSYRIALVTNAFWLRSEEDVEKYRPMFEMLSNLYISAYKKINDDLVEEIRKYVSVKVNKRITFYEVELARDRKDPVLPEKVIRGGKCSYITCPQLLPDGRLMKCMMGYSLFSSYRTPEDLHLEDCEETFYNIENPSEDLKTWRSRYPFNLCYHCRIRERNQHGFVHRLM